MKLIRTLVLFVCSIGLLGLAGFVMSDTTLAAPAALAGVSSFLIALA